MGIPPFVFGWSVRGVPKIGREGFLDPRFLGRTQPNRLKNGNEDSDIYQGLTLNIAIRFFGGAAVFSASFMELK